MPEVCRSPALKCRILTLENFSARQPTTARPVQDRRDAINRGRLALGAMPGACFVHRAGDDLSPFRIRDVVPRVIAPPGGNALLDDPRRQVIWIGPSPQRPTRLAAFPLLAPGVQQTQERGQVAQLLMRERGLPLGGDVVEVIGQRLDVDVGARRDHGVCPSVARLGNRVGCRRLPRVPQSFVIRLVGFGALFHRRAFSSSAGSNAARGHHALRSRTTAPVPLLAGTFSVGEGSAVGALVTAPETLGIGSSQ